MSIGSGESNLKCVQCLEKNPILWQQWQSYIKKRTFFKVDSFVASYFGSRSSTVLNLIFLLSSLTVFRRSLIRLVDGDAETLVASPPPDHVRPRAVKRHLGLDATLLGLWHGRLEALEGAGLPEAQGRAQRSTSWRLWETKDKREGGRAYERRGGRMLNGAWEGGQGKMKKPGWRRRREISLQNEIWCRW